MENQSVQERTGQVAPQTSSPQSQPVQPYQQSGSNIQSNNRQLLDAPSNVQIVVPTGSPNQGTGSTSTALATTSKNSIGMTVLIIFSVLLVCVVVIKLLKPRKNNAKEVSDIQPTESPAAYVVDTSKDEPRAPSDTKLKSKKSKQKAKKKKSKKKK